jgi:hypothetical protein
MNRKTELLNNLEIKLENQENSYLDKYLQNHGIKFNEGNNSYDTDQRTYASKYIDESEIPKNTLILKNLLNNIKTKVPNPTSLPNFSDNTKFLAYNFLKKLQEPASNYFATPKIIIPIELSVIEYLVIKYDTNYPRQKDEFDANAQYDNAHSYLGIKKIAIEDLKNAFINRGIIPPKDNKKNTIESLSKTMTISRYQYLTDLANLFNINPTSEKIINFVKELPGKIKFDTTINLSCDNPQEFIELYNKYIPNYNTLNNIN